ncbi:MAG: metallophosphoesterase [Lachnospiraceae bacterium]|nr:metallophosphoesterase [Lachnospiraceae bacterium]
MIYITGDTHGTFNYRFSKKSFPEQEQMTKDDYLIILGDFGGIWNQNGESEQEKYWLDWFEERNYTLLFIDGNHENFDRLYNYPVKEWHGGKVHQIRPHVLHLMRGQIFEINGKIIFTFGGALSHDIDGGILNIEDHDFKKKKKELDEELISYRINHLSWWEQELPSPIEMDEGLINLAKYDNMVDFIITHCCSSSTQREISYRGSYEPDIETDYLESIKTQTHYKKWFFGHYHDNMNVSDKEILIYEQIIRIQ